MWDKTTLLSQMLRNNFPEDNFGTVVGENQSCYGILSLWVVNGLSIVCWVVIFHQYIPQEQHVLKQLHLVT